MRSTSREMHRYSEELERLVFVYLREERPWRGKGGEKKEESGSFSPAVYGAKSSLYRSAADCAQPWCLFSVPGIEPVSNCSGVCPANINIGTLSLHHFLSSHHRPQQPPPPPPHATLSTLWWETLSHSLMNFHLEGLLSSACSRSRPSVPVGRSV